MSNLAKTAPEITEVQNLLKKLGELDKKAEETRREELRSAWGHGIFNRNEAINTAKRIRSQIGEHTAAVKHPHQIGGATKVTEARLPEGRYAIDTADGAVNETAFYVVKWWDGRNGRMFSIYRLSSDEETKVPFQQSLSIAGRILDAGTKESLLRFGREIGVCGHCGRTLTNDESRAKGIGPICEGRF
jgi:hypothetical protein